jgi:hypothetical protein
LSFTALPGHCASIGGIYGAASRGKVPFIRGSPMLSADIVSSSIDVWLDVETAVPDCDRRRHTSWDDRTGTASAAPNSRRCPLCF